MAPCLQSDIEVPLYYEGDPIEFRRAFENSEQVRELIRRREKEPDPYSIDRDQVLMSCKRRTAKDANFDLKFEALR
jgi:hypothetical protein